MSSHSDVEAELARLKSGGSPEAIEGGESGGDILEAAPETTESTTKDPQ
jgi:hypothetical protein